MFNISKLNFIKLSRIFVIAFVIAVFCIPLVTFLPEKYAENLGIFPAGATTATVQVAANADDSSNTSGAYDNTSVSETMGKTAAVANNAAFRFLGVTIPAGAHINSAYITFTADATRASQAVILRIKGEDTDTPAAYGAAEDFTSRTYTTAYVAWSGTVSWTLDTAYNSPDISTIVQELVNTYDYSAGLDMSFEVIDNGSTSDKRLSAYSHDGDAAKCPTLVIKYAPADAYWVGGSGTWGDDDNHWATVSGGAPADGNLPYTYTNVHFDANSDTGATFSVTLNSSSNCISHDFDASAIDQIMNLKCSSGATANHLRIYGSFVGSSSLVLYDNSGTGNYIYFSSIGAETITWGGTSDFDSAGGNYTIYFNGTGSWQFQDDCALSLTHFTFEYGDIDINNRVFTCHCWNMVLGGTTHSITLGSATVNCTNIDNTGVNLTGFTFSGASATFNLSGTIIELVGQTYGTINSTGNSATISGNNTITTLTSSGASVTLSGNNTITTGTFTGGGVTLSGANTFTTLNITGTAVLNDTVNLGGNQTVTTTLNLDGNSQVNRLLIKSNTLGTPRTLTLTGATVSGCTNVDFLDITATPAIDLSAITGGSGNLGGNTGITFTTADDIYWVGNSGLWSASLWADSSGGVAGSGRMPLAQDTAIFDENSFTVTNRTVTVDVPYVGNINALDSSNYGTIYSASTVNCYGNLSLGAIGFNTVSGLYMYGRNAPMIGCTTYNITGDVYLYPYGTTLTLSDDLYLTGTLYLRCGTADFLAHNVLAGYFDSSTTTYTRVLSPDGAIIQLNGTSATTKWNVNATNFTLSANTCLIIFTNSTTNAQTFTGGTGITTYYGLEITGSASYTTTFTTANTFAYIYVDRTEAAKTLAGNVTLTVSAFIAPVVGTTTVTITNTDFSKASGTVVSDYLVISGSTASGGASFYAGANATDSGGNSGWTFTDAPTPIVSTLGISNLGTTTITLNGSIDTLSGVSGGYVYFEYGLTTAYGYGTTHVGKSTVGSFTADVSGLNQGTTYHYRAVFTYSGGTVYGNDLEFITVSISGAAVVYTSSAINVGNATATLVGTIITLGNYTNALGYFEYGTTTSYEKGATPVTNLTTTGSYSIDLISLETETEYHFRAVLYCGAGYYAYGADRTFTTSGGLSNVTIIQINGVDVYKNVVETGDNMFFVDFTVLYGTYSNVYVPSTPIGEAYFIRLMDSVGDEVMSATPFAFFDNGYNRGLVAMYATAAEVTSLGIVWGDDYSVKIYGNPTAAWTEYPIPASSVFNSFIWRPDASVSNQRAIIAKRIVYNYANVIQVDWAKDTTHYTYANYGLYLISNGSYYLTSAGQTYFGGVIPYLTTIAPSILGGYVVEPDVVDVKITHNTSWQTSIDDMTEHTIFGVARTKLGTLITGVSGRMVTGILWLLGMLVIIIAAARKINSFKPAILLSFPLLIFGILVGWIPILVGLGMAFLFGAATIYIFTWEKSSS